MKKILPTLLFLFCLASLSCNDKKQRTFNLTIYTVQDGLERIYILNERSLEVLECTHEAVMIDAGTVEQYDDTLSVYQSVFKNVDTLNLIALLDVKSYSCTEQHELNAYRITFDNDSISVGVDPAINHPKELDYAVRLINSVVPAAYFLQFRDMQEAIEPDGKLRL